MCNVFIFAVALLSHGHPYIIYIYITHVYIIYIYIYMQMWIWKKSKEGATSRRVCACEEHGGKVPIHGRLFAQWLHYVFPRDCAFPYKSGQTQAGEGCEGMALKTWCS